MEREQQRLEGLTERTAAKTQEAAALGKKIERYQKQQVAIQKIHRTWNARTQSFAEKFNATRT